MQPNEPHQPYPQYQAPQQAPHPGYDWGAPAPAAQQQPPAPAPIDPLDVEFSLHDDLQFITQDAMELTVAAAEAYNKKDQAEHDRLKAKAAQAIEATRIWESFVRSYPGFSPALPSWQSEYRRFRTDMGLADDDRETTTVENRYGPVQFTEASWNSVTESIWNSINDLNNGLAFEYTRFGSGRRASEPKTDDEKRVISQSATLSDPPVKQSYQWDPSFFMLDMSGMVVDRQDKKKLKGITDMLESLAANPQGAGFSLDPNSPLGYAVTFLERAGLLQPGQGPFQWALAAPHHVLADAAQSLTLVRKGKLSIFDAQFWGNQTDTEGSILYAEPAVASKIAAYCDWLLGFGQEIVDLPQRDLEANFIGYRVLLARDIQSVWRSHGPRTVLDRPLIQDIANEAKTAVFLRELVANPAVAQPWDNAMTAADAAAVEETIRQLTDRGEIRPGMKWYAHHFGYDGITACKFLAEEGLITYTAPGEFTVVKSQEEFRSVSQRASAIAGS